MRTVVISLFFGLSVCLSALAQGINPYFAGPGPVPGSTYSPTNRGAYADPRDFGDTTTCASGTFNINNATHDDAPAFNLALATGLPVVIPFPGCKWVTQVVAPAAGATIFTFAGAGPYDSLGSANTQPYIYVPDAARTNATNSCVFDTRGYDGVTWRYVTVIGSAKENGVSAFCNSIGIADGRPQAFAYLDHVSVSRVGNAIGDSMNTTCVPTGLIISPVFQIDIQSIRIGETCFGIYANYSDMHINSFYGANIYNNCIAAPAGAGVSLEIVNWRCEYTGHFEGNPALVQFDGAGIYVANLGMNHITNGICDHVFGSCILLDGHNAGYATQTSLSQIQSKDSVTGGAVSEGGVIANPCHWVFKDQVVYASGKQMQAEAFTSLTKYTLCFDGTQSSNIGWDQMASDGPNGGGGWRTSFLNGTLPVSFKLDTLGNGVRNYPFPTVKQFTRDMTAATASVAYTGFGFRPKACTAFGAVSASVGVYTAIAGAADPTITQSDLALGGPAASFPDTSLLFNLFDATGSNAQAGTVASFDADGITVSWAKSGTPTGTFTGTLLCFP